MEALYLKSTCESPGNVSSYGELKLRCHCKNKSENYYCYNFSLNLIFLKALLLILKNTL